MKKILTLLTTIALAACTFYPLGMSESEWNALSREEKIEARREEAKLREERRLRYAIERQNRLKEERIRADNNTSHSTAQAAAAAASAAQAASQSASAAQQASQNTSTNNITVNPNIVVSNDNSNAVSQNQSNNQTQANSNNSSANNSGSVTNKAKATAKFSKKKKCFEYHARIKSGDRLFKKKEYRLAEKAYKRAYRKACTDAQESNAKAKIEKAKALKPVNTSSSGDNRNCKQYDHFMKKGERFMGDKKYHQAVQAYEKAIDFACDEEKKMKAKTNLADAMSKK